MRMIKKAGWLTLVIGCFGISNAFAESNVFTNGYRGDWQIYSFGLYQPTIRTISGKDTPPVNYNRKWFLGIGLGKDNLRIEYTNYLHNPRIEAAYDFFPSEIITPYIAFIDTIEDEYNSDDSNSQSLIKRYDGVIGVTFQPFQYLGFYSEYLLKDSFFFVGVRVRLVYHAK